MNNGAQGRRGDAPSQPPPLLLPSIKKYAVMPSRIVLRLKYVFNIRPSLTLVLLKRSTGPEHDPVSWKFQLLCHPNLFQ